MYIPVQDTWLGRVLNNFRYFEVSHISMFFVFYAVLLVHPIPGLPGRDNGDRRSVTWVRHAYIRTLPYVTRCNVLTFGKCLKTLVILAFIPVCSRIPHKLACKDGK